MMASLQKRLLVGTIGSIMLLVAIFSLIIYSVIRQALTAQFDAGLESTARLYAGGVEWEEGRFELDFAQQQASESGHLNATTLYEIWDADGNIIGKSPQLKSENFPRLGDGIGAAVFATRPNSEGRFARVVGMRLIPRVVDEDWGPVPSETLSLTVARDAGVLQGHLAFLRRLLWIASAAVAVLSVLVATLVVRRGLAPLNLMATQIASIKADDLAARVEARNVPTEIAPVRDRLNDLLEHLQASFERERRFTADVAHELRTPLAGMRSTLEVTLLRTRDTSEYQVVLADCLAIAENMQAMTNNLLMLTRLDAKQVSPRRERIYLADLLESCWLASSETASRRRVTFESTIPQDFTCISDPDSLSMVLSNILVNAAEYADEGGRIWAAARHVDQHVELSVSNTGCTLTDEQLSQVFDRFWRADASRTDASIHCGLGLALVTRLMNVLRGSVTVERSSDGIFTVRLNLPGAEGTEDQSKHEKKGM